MDVPGIDKLFICYIPGMDLRRINTNNAPYITRLFNLYPWAKIKTLPNVELVPTLLTGVYPHEHGIWQVKLRSDQSSSLKYRLIDEIPDILITTFQCLVHLFNQSFDLAAIPSKRRRLLELKRFKYTRREKSSEILFRIGGVESIFSIVGKGKGKYVFSKKFDGLDKLLYNLCSQDYRLEFLELYSLDILQHWNLDETNEISKFYRGIDNFVKNLHEKCQSKNSTLMILSDHGQEQVKGSIDIKKELKKLNLPENEYNFYTEVPMARFWFHTDRARRKIVDMLYSIDNGTVLSYKDMHKYNVKFDDDEYGEIYFIVDPGYIIFPHDFYQPLANIFLGLTDWQQRSRIFNPKHRGVHGYLPQYDSERGFIMILDHNNYRIDKRDVDIIDVAPSILGLLGYGKANYMEGNCIFNTK